MSNYQISQLESTPADVSCCGDFARSQVSRRSILQSAVALGGVLGLTQVIGDSMIQATFAATPGKHTLVVLSLRGGIDGLGVVVPHGDPGYYKARPSTAVPAASLVCADAMFGLHPAMVPLQSLWAAGELAAIHATGLEMPNRSHFAAMEAVESAEAGSQTRSGWINRMIGLGSTSDAALNAVQLGMNFPSTAVNGPRSVLSTTDLSGLQIIGLDGNGGRYSSLQTAWLGAETPLAGGFMGKRLTSRRDPVRRWRKWRPQRSRIPRPGMRHPSPNLCKTPQS